MPIGQATESFNLASEVQDSIKILEDLVGKFETTRSGERESLRLVDTEGKEFEKRVKKFRQNVNQMLDKLESAMILKKNEINGEEIKVIKQRLGVCETALENLKDGLQKMKMVQKGKNEQRSFIAVNTVKVLKGRYEEILVEIKEGKGTFTLTFIPNNDLVAALDSLGSINVKSTIKPAEISNGTVEKHRLAKVEEIDVRTDTDSSVCTITGCVCLQSGELVLADETNNSVKVVGPNNKVMKSVKLEYSPWDLTEMKSLEVAVRSSFTESKREHNKIHVLTIGDTITEARGLEVDGRPRALAYHSPHLYVAVAKEEKKGNKIQIVVINEMDGRLVKTITPPKGILKEPQYICFNKEKRIMFISDFYHGVTALSVTGAVHFDLVKASTTEYGGVTVDDNDDIFVCAGKPYGIYRISSDGSSLTPFVTWENDNIDPQALTFCSHKQTFIVTSCNSDKAFVYAYI